MRFLGLLLIYLSLAAAMVAGDLTSQRTVQFIGRWESFSFASTNFDVFMHATNVILCVYKVDWDTNSTTKLPEAQIDLELRYSRVRDGKQQEGMVSDSGGHGWLTEGVILFGGLGGFGLNYRLTNGVLTFEKHVPSTYRGADHSMHFKAELKRVSSHPGKRLW